MNANNIEELINNFNDYIKNPAFELYMIEYNEKIAGIVELGTYEDAYKDNMEISEYIYIKENYRNQGIGSRLLNQLLLILKNQIF